MRPSRASPRAWGCRGLRSGGPSPPIATTRHSKRPRISAKTLRVSGTPCAFVNGYRVAGAVPTERFVAVIDAQFAKARALADTPNKDNPTKGPTKAKVTGP